MTLLKSIFALSAAGLLGASAVPARAGDVSIDLQFNTGHRGPPPIYQPYQPYQPAYQPVYQPAVTRVWVAPVYNTVTENTWHEPVTQDSVSTQWVPDEWALQDVRRVDQFGRRIIVREQVLVVPGHMQDIHTPVVVQAGYWAPEAKTVLVRDGYWQTVEAPPVVYVAPAPPPPPYCWPAPRQDVHVYYDRHYDRR